MRYLAIAVLVSCASPASDATDAAPPSPDGTTTAAPRIPSPTGTCPAIVEGEVTFAPSGIAPRKVRLSLDAAATTPGPLVLYWHATGSAPLEAGYALGATATAIEARGGVVAAPASDPAAGTFEWFVVNQSPRLDDFAVADEIVGCLVQAGRVDPARIHSMGMSAGGLQTTAMSYLRSAYVASVATYSGGLPAGFPTPTPEDATNKLAALIFFGGASDQVFGLDFAAASKRFRDELASNGHFTVLCDHGNGHEIPRDAAAGVAAFFEANPFGAWPSPLAGGLPASMPTYCAR